MSDDFLTVEEIRRVNAEKQEEYLRVNKKCRLVSIIMVLVFWVVFYLITDSIFKFLFISIVFTAVIFIFLWWPLLKVIKEKKCESENYLKISTNLPVILTESDGIIIVPKNTCIVVKEGFLVYGDSPVEKNTTGDKYLLVHKQNDNLFIKTTGQVLIYTKGNFDTEILSKVRLIG